MVRLIDVPVGDSVQTQLSVAARYTNSRKMMDDFEVGSKVLGSGLNGPVRPATHKESGRTFAVKSFSKASLSAKNRVELKNEAKIHLSLDHPHVLRIEMVYEDAADVHLVTELMEGGELYDRLSSRKQYTENVAADTIHQILLSLAYLHGQNIVHRDIKLENFLYESPDSDHLKLIDFGFAKHWDLGERMNQACGSLYYVAPEVLRKSYTNKADLWSVGVVSYMLLTGRPPFGGSDDEVLRGIKAADVRWSTKFTSLSQGAQDFVKKLLVLDPDDRLSAADALNNTWVRERHRLSDIHFDLGSLSSLRKFAHAAEFRRATLSMMALSLTVKQQNALREEFLAIADCSGKISLPEFQRALQSQFHIDTQECEVLFDRVDLNHDHSISYSEFLAATLQARVGLHEDAIRTTFNHFDVDAKGFITEENLQQVIGGSFEGRGARQLVDDVDLNKDGRICLDEFAAYIHDMDKEATPKNACGSDCAPGLWRARVARG